MAAATTSCAHASTSAAHVRRRLGVTPTTARKVLASTPSALLSSSPALRRRSLSCSAASAATAPRIAQQPPDLLRVSATADSVIPPGAVLIDLPGRIPLRLRRPADAADAVLMQLADQVPEELWAMRLGLRLLQERTKFDSFWWPYIANLPETFTVPIFFPGEDIKNLQYAPLLHQINKRCRFLLEFEKEVKQKLGTVPSGDHPFCGQDVHSSSLGWAMSAASSRAFRLHGEIPMLLPLVDMCNHSFSPNARIVQDGDVESPDMSVKVSLGGPDIVDGRLLAALRVLLAADPEAVGKHGLKTLMSLSAKAPLGPTVEASTFRTVLALCAIALQHFHTKIMDDQAILKGEPPLTTELAVQFRLQKKLLLVDIMQNLSRRIKTLSPEKSTA
ncbi:hypothetical protein ZWY2020_022278 [Hordeum vulgare]|nr:hypothetical protein ZWY2020_022278 [Hordeum vulgare]